MRIKESSNSMSYFKNEISTITFQCKYNTSFGQSLRIVGNIEELGAWNPENSLLLVTDPSMYPVWKSTTEIICPVGMEIIYKYILKSDDGNIIWENLPNNENRKITVSSQGKFIINDEEGIIKSNIIKEEITKRSKSIMELKADLTENFSKKDLFSYNLNEISNINNELYDTFIFSENQKLNSEDRIIIASTFLPFEIIKSDNEDNKYKINLGDDNLIYQILFDMKEKHFCDVFWVGMLKNYKDFDEIEIEEIAEFLQQKNIYLVIVSEKEFNDYQMYMSKIITPVFIDSTIDLSNEYFLSYENYFSAFQTINKKFANMIHNFIQIKDLLMINDIGLCLIPNSLMQKNLYSRVGIYFHMSFPSSDVFKALPKSDALIKSVLLCDVIGFHVFNYARNFLTVLNRDFGIYYEIKHNGFITLNYLGKYIILHIMHAGIDMDSIIKITNNNEYNSYIEKYKGIIGDKISFLSIDNTTELAQLKLKLDAYEKFLEKHEEYKGKSILIQILKMNTDLESKNISYIEKYVSHIKEKFGEDSISFQKYDQNENSINTKEEIALYTLCEILLILQKWRGICTSVNQFLLCKSTEKKFGLIISESIGVSSTVKSPIRVNPFNKNEIVSAMEKILNRPDDIKNDYYEKDMYYIKRNSTFSWIKAFFSDLKRVTIDNEKYERVELGIGFNFRLMKLSKDFKHLNLNNLIASYKKSKKRLFFFDYEETLQTFEEMDITQVDLSDKVILETHTPNERIISILNSLCSDSKNEIYIITGRKKKFLKSWFGNIKNLGLGAEYGFFYKKAGLKKDSNDNADEDGFNQLINVKDWSWKDAALNILKEFTEKTEGSKLTLKESSISWSYKNSDPYFGHIQANEVSVHLLNFFGDTKLDVVIGKDYVEIKPKNINKGFFISQILLKNLENNDIPDFIFAIGDDTSDEEMFKFLNYVNREQYRVNENIKIYTTTMGKKPSVANYYITEPGEFVEYLEMLYHHN